MTIATYMKDPSAVLEYPFNWSEWLEEGNTISSYVVTVPAGLTLDSDSESGGIVIPWISGGTHGENYLVACLITTTNTPERKDERTILIRCRNR